MKRETVASIEMTIVNVLWGLSFIASKTALLGGFRPFTLACIRFAISSVLLLPILYKKEGTLKLRKGTFWPLLWSSLLGMTLYFICEYNGLERTSTATASMIIAAIPAVTLIYGVIFKHRRHSVISYLGVAASVAGVFLVVCFGQSEGQNSLTGNLFIFGACLCWVAYIEVTDKLAGKCTNLEITCWQSVLGCLTLFPCCFTEHIEWKSVPVMSWLMTLYLAVLCSVLCYLWYVDAIKVLGPLRSSLYININPVASVLGGVLLLGETVTPLQLVGGVIVMASIFLVNRESAIKA